METLQQIIKYRFKDESLLRKALTHASVNSHVDSNYERLEFLGDRVLGVSVASLLYQSFPKEPEGNLSTRFVSLVCKETVASVALTLHLDRYIEVAVDELRHNENVLCDVCEAVIGAIYIDAGVDAAIEFVDTHWRALIDKNMAPPKDSKSKLQEQAARLGLAQPVYTVVSRTGSEHEPCYEIEVSVGEAHKARGTGRSKKLAEFAAASTLLETLH